MKKNIKRLFLEIGTPKSSILVGCFTKNHLFWGIPHLWKLPYCQLDMSDMEKVLSPFQKISELAIDVGRISWKISKMLDPNTQYRIPMINQLGAVIITMITIIHPEKGITQ